MKPKSPPLPAPFTALVAIVAASFIPMPARAAPGLGSEVYGATVTRNEFEAAARYDRLLGGTDNGEDVLSLEAGYGLSDRLHIGLFTELEREPAGPRKAEAFGIEAIYALGRAGPITMAIYGEYELKPDGTDAVESKLLLQHRHGPIDLRLNLIAEKPLDSHLPVELKYAGSADVETLGEVRLGVQAFGELGTFSHFLPRAEHFVGPVAKFEIEGLGPEIGIEAGYLFALGKARDDSKGQLRLALELEF